MAKVTSSMLHTAESRYGDLEGKQVADLGCGCGVLTIASVMLECENCISYDIDTEALDICRQNLEDYDIDNVELKEQDIQGLDPADTALHDVVDTVVLNPPFGTKNNEGIDMHFLKVALAMARTAVYSLHKTTTRQHIEKKSADWGMCMKVEARLRYNLSTFYPWHKHKAKDIDVDFIRFSFKDQKQVFKEKLKATVTS